ncbi:rubrerythrin [Halobacteriales archaeon SW_7_68_16]|nr:MAG: rubrerythrin [Halobacteriales archaeon SW_7_68_16]
MSLGQRVVGDHQLARLLQIGIVLEEVVEARARRHAESTGLGLSDDVRGLLADAASEASTHRERLEGLIVELEAETVAYEEIEVLVREQYASTRPEDFDGVLYDQLCSEETAYKFYDDLLGAIEASETDFGIGRERLVGTLRGIRADEEAGVAAVTDLMDSDADTDRGER